MSLTYQSSENKSHEWFKNQAVCLFFTNKDVEVKSLQNFSTPGIYCILTNLPVSTPIKMTASGFSKQGNAFLWAYIPKHKIRLTTNYTLLPLNVNGSVSTTFSIPNWASGSPVYVGILFTAPYIGDQFTLSSITFNDGGGGGDGGDDCKTECCEEEENKTSLSINNNIYLDKVLEFSKSYHCCVPDYDSDSHSEKSDCHSDNLPCYVFDECHDINHDSNFVPCKLQKEEENEPCRTDSLQTNLESLFKLQENLSNALQKNSAQIVCPTPPVTAIEDVKLSTFDSFLTSLL
jgi:hypothetical protein